jgi:hypothetical protein
MQPDYVKFWLLVIALILCFCAYRWGVGEKLFYIAFAVFVVLCSWAYIQPEAFPWLWSRGMIR